MGIKLFDHSTQINNIREKLDQRFASVIESGQFIQGPEVKELEQALAKYLGVKHCISTSNGTDAILASLMAIGIGPGDEVITPAFSYIAAAESIKLLGASPVYIDVDSKTYNLDSAQLKQHLTPRTKAIIAIDLFGQAADYDDIYRQVEGRDITVIEDAAQSLGGIYKNRKTGTLADITTTSFFPTKPLGCFGDGGAIFTNNDKLARALDEITKHGQSEKYRHTRLGINGRLDTLQAAVLLEKLPLLEEAINSRQLAAKRYDRLITGMLGEWNIEPPVIESHNSSAYAQYTIQLPHRDKVKSLLSEAGIPTAVHYPLPIYQQWSETPKNTLANTEQLCGKVLSLPLYPLIPEEHQIEVLEGIKRTLEELSVI